MLYEIKNGKIITKSIEYSVAYHCNFKCSGCSHLSPFTSKYFPTVDEFSADIYKLSKVLHAGVIRLLGGEPLLNPDINQFLKIARDSGIADHVMVTTNGSLLHKMDEQFWKSVDYVLVSYYPETWIKENLTVLRERAKSFNTELWFHMLESFRTTIVTKPHPKDWITGIIFKTCRDVHLFHCHMVHEGKLYKCAVPPFLPEYLSKMGIYGYDPIRDSFDLYSSKNVFLDLTNFLISSKTMEACRFCLGYLGKTQKHQQLGSEFLLNPERQDITRKKYLDRKKFISECTQYCRRRILEKLNRKKIW
jgi:hypothetical protein